MSCQDILWHNGPTAVEIWIGRVLFCCRWECCPSAHMSPPITVWMLHSSFITHIAGKNNISRNKSLIAEWPHAPLTLFCMLVNKTHKPIQRGYVLSIMHVSEGHFIRDYANRAQGTCYIRWNVILKRWKSCCNIWSEPGPEAQRPFHSFTGDVISAALWKTLTMTGTRVWSDGRFPV